MAVVLGCLGLWLLTGTPAAASPSFVVFVVDDLGWADVGANNPGTFYDTPHVNRLAESGMRFTAGYAACPVCSPSRAALMTGLYPQRTGVTDYIGAAQPENWKRDTPMLPARYETTLAHRFTTIAEVLRGAGYRTFFAGKWHLGPEGFWPEDQGFEVNRGGIDRGGPYGGDKYFSPYGNPRLADGPPGEHLPDRLATETVKFIEANRDRPFLAWLSFYSVHTPLMAREDLRKKYEAKAASQPTPSDGEVWGQERVRKVRRVQNHAVYAGMVEAMDAAVGKVLAALDRLKLSGETVVLFTSDNGGLSTSEGHPTSNLPLRAGKGWPYEGGVRVPFMIRVPGVTRAATTSEVPVCGIDVMPTLLDLAGLGAATDGLDGRSLVPVLRGGSLQPRPIFWHYPHYGNQGGAPCAAVREANWKLIEWYEDGRAELYHLGRDLGESNDLANRRPRRVTALKAKLQAWRAEVGARLPVSRDAGAGLNPYRSSR